jgi:hypothetical protein
MLEIIKGTVPLFENIPQDNIPKKKKKTFRNCLADIFNELLFERNIPLVRVQKETNIPFPTLDDWIKARSTPLADDNLMVLTKFLDTNMEYLCYGIGCPDSIETQAKRIAEYFKVSLDEICRIMEGELINNQLEELAKESVEWQMKA